MKVEYNYLKKDIGRNITKGVDGYFYEIFIDKKEIDNDGLVQNVSKQFSQDLLENFSGVHILGTDGSKHIFSRLFEKINKKGHYYRGEVIELIKSYHGTGLARKYQSLGESIIKAFGAKELIVEPLTKDGFVFADKMGFKPKVNALVADRPDKDKQFHSTVEITKTLKYNIILLFIAEVGFYKPDIIMTKKLTIGI